MINYMVGLWLVTTLTLAQTPQQPARQSAPAKSTSPKTQTSASKSVDKEAQPTSATAPARRLPDYPLSTKLRNNNTNNPNYNKEKAATGRGTKREYTPRRTKSGARRDTIK